MAKSELRTRAVLAPTMLLLIGLVYWLDHERVLLDKQGALSAAVLGLLGIGGVLEYCAMLKKAGFAVSRTLLLLGAFALHALAFPMGWHQLDRELYPLVAITLLILFPLAARSLGKDAMPGWIVGLVLVALSLFTTQMFPHPLWMMIAAVVLPLVAVLVAKKLVARRLTA